LVKKYDSSSEENMTFRNDLENTQAKVINQLKENITVENWNYSLEHRFSRDGIPRDYRDGAMIYETDHGVEKARLSELDSSSFLNAKFQI
jgi:hypothetical protein